MSTKRKKTSKSSDQGSRTLEMVIGAALAIGLVVIVFLVTNREDRPAPRPETAPPQTATVAQTPVQSPIGSADIATTDRIDVESAKELLDRGEAITIDVRDVQSYVAAHIPGALQIPLQYVAGEVPWFPRDKMIITYCT
ncbi:MAG: rhodanese-like domain-containing protein [Thermoanaerobaculia bacterium]|nr:rhodanese-like domain-containing protein [Thermoanaerobaculia bacterium]